MLFAITITYTMLKNNKFEKVKVDIYIYTTNY